MNYYWSKEEVQEKLKLKMEKAFGMNSGGWNYFMLDAFKKYFDAN
jgi:hypothetical protein